MNVASLLAAYRRSVCFIIPALFALFTLTYAQNTYVITGNSNSFTAMLSDSQIGTSGAIQTVIEAIRADAGGSDCSIQFGDGEGVLNLGSSAFVRLENSSGLQWGKVTLLGKITSSVDASDYWTVRINDPVSVDINADIEHTGGYTYVIRNNSTGTVNIIGGTISHPNANNNSIAFSHNSTGTVNVSGGKFFTEDGFTIRNESTGTINISGGTVETNTGTAIRNNGTGTVNISGGRVEAIGSASGIAIHNFNNGLITISGDAVVASNHPGTYSMGTIFLGTNYGTLEISGGTVENTSTATNARAVSYDNSDSPTIKITGGTIATGGDNALQLLSTNQYREGLALILGGSPSITGNIKIKAGALSIITEETEKFAPGSKIYTLDLDGYTGVANSVAVKNGANFSSNFNLASNVANSDFAVSGKDLVATVFDVDISSEQELRDFAAKVNNGNDYSGKTVRLANDIELTNNWIPIGKYNKPFRGIFDGQGHKISNLSVKGEYSWAGLFGSVENGAVIMNIGVEGADIEVNDPDDDEAYAGILVGCTNYEDEGTAVISNSYAIGKVSSSDENDAMIFIGGLVGDAYGSLTITNSYAITELDGGSGDMVLVGGLLGATGYSSDLKIEYSYAIGDMFEDAGSWGSIGGILGYDMGEATAISVYYKSGVNNNLTGTTALNDTELKNKDTFDGWDFANVWGINSEINNGYPYLLKFATQPPPPTCSEDEELVDDVCIPKSTPIRSLPQLASQISVQTASKTIMLGNLPSNTKIEMYNLQGKRIYSANSGNSQSLKIFAQTKGVYIVKISHGSEKKTLSVSVM